MKALLVLFTLATAVFGETQTDIEYARVGDVSLKLDLHRPEAKRPPVVVYVHGGAWRAGSKSDVPVAGLLERGFAIASVDYRLSTQARFPAQIQDIKAAIQSNFAMAEIFFQTLNVINIVQTPMFDVRTILM